MTTLTNEFPYHIFAQYFIEIVDHLKSLEENAEKLLSDGKEVSLNLERELYRHTTIFHILAQAGQETYNKNPEEIYLDGQDFWMKGYSPENPAENKLKEIQ
jgi:hypothetical protein